MNLTNKIAQSITGHSQKSFSNFIIRLSTAATIISVAVMVIALAVVQGFKDTIKDKTFSFWGHFHVAASSMNNSLEYRPQHITMLPSTASGIAGTEGVAAVHPYVLGAGLLATAEDNQGVQIKGVAQGYLAASVENVISIEGGIQYNDTSYSNDIVVSQNLLAKINKAIGDELLLYVLENEEAMPRVRKVKIAGTYHLGIEEIDDNFILCDIKMLQRIFNFQPHEISGLQVSVVDYNQADAIAEKVYYEFIQSPQSILYISDIYAEIFQWLELQDVNARIILSIMAIVAVINMITALLTFILERLNMIGILKALGMNNWNIRKVFVYHFGRIVIKGIIGGILLGLLLCWLQAQFQILKVDESVYYMQYVPIKVLPLHLIGIVIGTLLISICILTVATLIIKNIKIVQSIKFK